MMGEIVSLRKTDLSQQVQEECHALSKKIVSRGVDLIISDVLALPQCQAPVTHTFGPGVYVREVLIPAGSFAVGHFQRFEHLNFFVKGRVIMFNDDGSMTDLRAPLKFVGKPGRKMGYVVEDVVWHNIYATTETDVDILEDALFVKTEEFKNYCEIKLQAERVKRDIDRQDYENVLKEFGYTHEQVKAEVENESDQIYMNFPRCRVSDSPISGKGFFVTTPHFEGQVIAVGNAYGKRTPAGRYTNHSITPNAECIQCGGSIYLVATRYLRGCLGGGVGEEVTIDYRQALRLRSESCQV